MYTHNRHNNGHVDLRNATHATSQWNYIYETGSDLFDWLSDCNEKLDKIDMEQGFSVLESQAQKQTSLEFFRIKQRNVLCSNKKSNTVAMMAVF